MGRDRRRKIKLVREREGGRIKVGEREKEGDNLGER